MGGDFQQPLSQLGDWTKYNAAIERQNYESSVARAREQAEAMSRAAEQIRQDQARQFEAGAKVADLALNRQARDQALRQQHMQFLAQLGEQQALRKQNQMNEAERMGLYKRQLEEGTKLVLKAHAAGWLEVLGLAAKKAS